MRGGQGFERKAFPLAEDYMRQPCLRGDATARLGLCWVSIKAKGRPLSSAGKTAGLGCSTGTASGGNSGSGPGSGASAGGIGLCGSWPGMITGSGGGVSVMMREPFSKTTSGNPQRGGKVHARPTRQKRASRFSAPLASSASTSRRDGDDASRSEDDGGDAKAKLGRARRPGWRWRAKWRWR